MRFWTREIAGWGLVVLGIGLLLSCYPLLMNHQPVEAGQWMVVGFVVYRGGIHLLKVAIAARVCVQAVDEIAGEQPKAVVPRPARPRPSTLPRADSRW